MRSRGRRTCRPTRWRSRSGSPPASASSSGSIPRRKRPRSIRSTPCDSSDARVKFKRPGPSAIVLGLLCVMYFVTYVDRVNVATAAGEIKRELALSNTQLGFVFSAFAYPYLLFQVFGGWIGDRFG